MKVSRYRAELDSQLTVLTRSLKDGAPRSVESDPLPPEPRLYRRDKKQSQGSFRTEVLEWRALGLTLSKNLSAQGHAGALARPWAWSGATTLQATLL
jgi:hypothetical protein